MNEAKELLEFLENLDIKLFEIVQKIEGLKKVNIVSPLNFYTKNPKNPYPNFVIKKLKIA